MPEATPSASPDRPLAGIKVVDCTRVLSGPICSRMLADMGADVVKIEAPESDILRSTPPIVGGFGSMFAQYNVGKRNVSIDLKHDEGPGVLAALIAEADVLVENFRPGVLGRLGLAPDTTGNQNEGVIVGASLETVDLVDFGGNDCVNRTPVEVPEHQRRRKARQQGRMYRQILAHKRRRR